MSGHAAIAPEGGMPSKGRYRSAAAVVAASGLPAELGQRVLEVTGKCRLWNRERVAVAQELTAHFRDGLESGAAPADLLAGFGEPRAAARLIGRAMRRKRPVWWKLWVRGWQATGVLLLLALVLYGYWAAQYWLRTPRIARNYLAEMNAPVLAIPEPERAWTLYREALVKLPKVPEIFGEAGQKFPALSPGQPGWAEAVKFVEDHQVLLEKVRGAARLDKMGYRMTSNGDPLLMKARNPGYEPSPEDLVENENPDMVGILLPHLAMMRELARWFAFDARYAASLGDGARAAEDLRTLVGLARHSAQGSILINQLVGMAILSLEADLALELLTNHPQLLGEKDLIGLIHANAEWTPSGERGSGEAIDLSGEANFMDDFLQRNFSDDGHGNGHLTAQGAKALEMITMAFGQEREKGSLLNDAFGPIGSALTADRKTLRAHHQSMMRRMIEEGSKPKWTRDFSLLDHEIAERGQRRITNSTWISDIFFPALTKCFESNDLTLMRRDAAVTVMAIELFKRRHGKYPASLAELTPGYLPVLPIDRWDGRPLRYMASGNSWSNGRPVLYSVGRDKIDEQGGVANWERPEDGSLPGPQWTPGVGMKPIGDWIFWPVPEPRKPEEPAAGPVS